MKKLIFSVFLMMVSLGYTQTDIGGETIKNSMEINFSLVDSFLDGNKLIVNNFSFVGIKRITKHGKNDIELFAPSIERPGYIFVLKVSIKGNETYVEKFFATFSNIGAEIVLVPDFASDSMKYKVTSFENMQYVQSQINTILNEFKKEKTSKENTDLPVSYSMF